jgi:hypothetical protein
MRGLDITSFTSPAHHLLETAPAHVATIGIGDGGNELGMGKIPWEVVADNIPSGEKIACRIPTTHLIVAGVSNWGAYALAAGMIFLSGKRELSRLFDGVREAQLWESVLLKVPLVDGVTGRPELSVDGLDWNEYQRPLDQIRTLLS